MAEEGLDRWRVEESLSGSSPAPAAGGERSASARAARSVSKLHQKIGSPDMKHAIRIEAPDPPRESQLPLV